MNIGVDASCWANKRGYGRYTRELLRTLLDLDSQNEYRLFLDSETVGQDYQLPEDVQKVIVRTSEAATKAASASGRRSLRDLWAMRRAVRQHGSDLDIFYFPSVYTFFPVKTRAKVIVTIHDTTAERYPELIFPNRRSRLFWKLKVRMAVRRADLIATVSQASRREIVREFKVPEDAVRVVPDAVGSDFHPIDEASLSRESLVKYGIGSEDLFVLYVGGISPHKNLHTLVEAHASLIHRNGARDVKLVLVGDYQGDVFHSCYADLSERIQALGLSESVVFTGFVDDSDLPIFYNRASALVMPSHDEGFGLPALEAMACGTPVVASRAGALPEVVGSAGRLFDPNAADELTRHLQEVLGDHRVAEEMGRKGLRRAREFSWERSASALGTVFEEVGRGRDAAAA